MIKYINYRVNPKQFSNRGIVNRRMMLKLARLVEGTTRLDAHGLLTVAALAETVVFNEGIIIQDENDILHSDEMRSSGFTFLYPSCLIELMEILESGKVIELTGARTSNSASEILYSEAACLGDPSFAPSKIVLIHDSHIALVYDDDYDNSAYVEKAGFDERIAELGKWVKRVRDTWDPSYLQAIEKYGYSKRSLLNPSPVPWKLLADCHGIPYISDPLYTLRDVNSAAPTNIGIDLYRRLERLHGTYFRKIRKYLGPTYVNMPPILSLVLQQCNSPEDLPKAMLAVRTKYKDFRKKCTSLEFELREAKSLSAQIEIIQEIESAYSALKSKVTTPKRRLLLRLFDIIKEVDPVHIGVEALDQAKGLLVDQEGLLKIPGYYNLWKASVDVEQGLPLLRRVFGSHVTSQLVTELNEVLDVKKRGVKSNEISKNAT